MHGLKTFRHLIKFYFLCVKSILTGCDDESKKRKAFLYPSFLANCGQSSWHLLLETHEHAGCYQVEASAEDGFIEPWLFDWDQAPSIGSLCSFVIELSSLHSFQWPQSTDCVIENWRWPRPKSHTHERARLKGSLKKVLQKISHLKSEKMGRQKCPSNPSVKSRNRSPMKWGKKTEKYPTAKKGKLNKALRQWEVIAIAQSKWENGRP